MNLPRIFSRMFETKTSLLYTTSVHITWSVMIRRYSQAVVAQPITIVERILQYFTDLHALPLFECFTT